MKKLIWILAVAFALPAAAQTTPAYLPARGGTLTGQTDSLLFNPFRASSGVDAMDGRFNKFILTGTIPGTSGNYNYGQMRHYLRSDYMLDTTPGCWGFQGNCYNTQHSVNVQTVYVNGGGGTNVNQISSNFFSVGDHIGHEDYITSFGGAIDNGGPEGTEGHGLYLSEAADTWTGAIASGHGGAGQTLLYTTCSTDCGSGQFGIPKTPGDTNAGAPASLGQGQILTDEQTTVASGQIESVTSASGETPGTFTVNITSGVSNLAVSTCEATLTSTLNPTVNPSGSGSQTLTFTVNDVVGTCTAGGLMSFAGTNHEQAIITSVTAPSGGQQTITANVRLYHESGSYVFENASSDAGLFADVVANHAGTLSYPFEALGVQSISGNTAVLWWRFWQRGFTPGVTGFPYGRMVTGTAAGTSASNTSGSVTLTVNTTTYIGNNVLAWQVFNNASAVYFSGAANSAFNGACTNVTVSGSTLTCTQAASPGQTSGTLSISLTDATNDNPYGNTRVNFYQGAAIVDPQDYSAPIVVNGVSNPVVDGLQFTVEPNEMTLAAGDALVEHHSEPEMRGFHGTNTVQDPVTPYVSYGLQEDITGINNNNYNNFAFKGTNGTSATNYHYFGGTLDPPPFIAATGLFSNYMFLQDPPEPGGAIIGVPNCPMAPSSCADANYWYALYNFKGNGGSNYNSYYPATNTMQWNGPQQFNSGLTSGPIYINGGGNPGLRIYSNPADSNTNYGDIRNFYGDLYFSGSGTAGEIYLNYDHGKGIVYFCNGNSTCPASINQGAAAFASVSISSGHTFKRHTTVACSLTFSAVAANTIAVQSGLTCTGLNAGDIIIGVSGPTAAAHTMLSQWQVTAASTLSVNAAGDATGGTPSGGTYTFDVEQ